MKTFGKTLLALSLTAAVASAAQADDKVLHVYNWSDYIGEETLAKFEAKTGIKPVYDVFDASGSLAGQVTLRPRSRVIGFGKAFTMGLGIAGIAALFYVIGWLVVSFAGSLAPREERRAKLLETL